uniref:hypothetical protein n=1 Tax=Citrobacter braakii TaxID=57706 RepID=UPI0015C5C35F
FVHSGGTAIDTTFTIGQSWLQTGAMAEGENKVNAGGEPLMDAGSVATDVPITGGTLPVADLTNPTASSTPAQVDKLTTNGGNV